MSKSIFNQMLIFTIICTLCLAHREIDDLEGLQSDSVLEEHFEKLTKYDHSFDEAQEGNCGVFFDLAVEELKRHQDFQDKLLSFSKTLDDANFDQNKCKYVLGAYSWVLLAIDDASVKCEVHVPLDLRNLGKEDKETYPLFNQRRAEMAIKKGDSWCYTVDAESEEKHKEISMPKREAFFQKMPATLYNLDSDKVIEDEEDNGDLLRKTLRPTEYESNDDEDEEDNRDFLNRTIRPTGNKSSDDDDEEQDTLLFNRKRERRGGMLLNANECTEEDKLRILELYAAEIIKDQALGYQIYTENIFDCKAAHHNVDTYMAKIHLNDAVCEFHAINDRRNVGLTFMPLSDEKLISCQNFKGFP